MLYIGEENELLNIRSFFFVCDLSVVQNGREKKTLVVFQQTVVHFFFFSKKDFFVEHET